MILTKDLTELICNKVGDKYVYECLLAKNKFGHAFFKSNMSSLGNIITFTASTSIGPIAIDKSLIVCGEMYSEDLFGGVCFHRLFSAQVGSVLTTLTNKQTYVDEGCIFLEKDQASIGLVNKHKGAISFHIIFSLDNGFDRLFNLSVLDEKQLTQFQNGIIDSFHFLTKSIFIETQRDNI